MAGVSKDRDGYRVQFTHAKQRYRIRLKGHNKRQAEAVARHIDALILSKVSGQVVDTVASAWVADIGDELYSKLHEAGLVNVRNELLPRSETLASFLDRFYARGRSNVGKKATDNTLKKWKTTIAYLKECLGESVSVENVTASDAIDFRGWLEDRDNINSENAVRKHCQTAKMFFNAAIDAEIIVRNPFRNLPTTSVENKEREYFVTRTEFDACIAKCPDLQWKVILYLTRVGGMRCPSELVRARWDDVDWKNRRLTIHATKTEGHAGREVRRIPLWPELESVLREAWEAAPKGENRILTRYTDSAQNLRTMFTKIIERAKLKPWPKLFQNLRASRENELIEAGVPAHVAAAWIGHSVKVQNKSYLQVAEHNYDVSLARD